MTKRWTTFVIVALAVAAQTAIAPARAAGPDNDDLADAYLLPPTIPTFTADPPSNAGATRESGEPVHSPDQSFTGGRSVWFTWTSPADKRVYANTCGSQIETSVAVYRGSTLAALRPIVRASDSLCSQVEFFAHSGTTYMMAVDGASDAGTQTPQQGAFSFGIGVETDRDFVVDFVEENVLGTSATDPDSDDDGLPDGVEQQGAGRYVVTDPADPDSDDDGQRDLHEQLCHYDYVHPEESTPSDPNTPSSTCDEADDDLDGLPSVYEVVATSDPMDADSDDDGAIDGLDALFGADWIDADSDDDGLDDGDEILTHFTESDEADTDGDGLDDGAEVNTHNTNPNDVDSDQDLVWDGLEVDAGTDPMLLSSVPSGPELVVGPSADASFKCRKVNGKKVCKVSGVEVRNVGTIAIPADSGLLVKLYKTEADLGADVPWGTGRIKPAIGADRQVSIAVKVTKGTPPAEFIAVVDPTNVIDELDDDNLPVAISLT